MISDWQRRLSLLLVAGIATGGLLVPGNVSGQGTTTQDQVSKSASTTLFDNPSLQFAPNTRFDQNAFTEEADGKTIVHKFRLSDPQFADQAFTQRYILATDIPVWAGCNVTETFGGQVVESRLCSASLPIAFDYFGTLKDPPDPRSGASKTESLTSHRIDIHAQAQAYRFENDVRAPLLIRYKDFIYGLYTLNNPDKSFIRAVRDKNRPLGTYVALVNKAKVSLLDGSKLDLGSLDVAARALIIRDQVKAIFSGVTVTKGVTLTDDEARSSPESLALSPPAPDSPPILTIATGLSGGDKATFKLDASPSVKDRTFGVDNNYFFFRLLPAPDTSQAIVDQLGGAGVIKDVYLVIDLMGNIAFVVDEPNNKGGIFKSVDKQKTLKGYIALGQFNARNGQASARAGGPGRIDPNRYRETITLRVYNEPTAISFPEQLEKTIGDRTIGYTHCATPIISYPDTNKGYLKPRFPDNLPDDAHRQCINRDAGGWLAKWGVNSGALDNPLNDPCAKAFEPKSFDPNPFNAIGRGAGKGLCGMVYALVGIATTFAKFSVDFLVEAVGVQT